MVERRGLGIALSEVCVEDSTYDVHQNARKGPTWRRGFVNYFLRVQHLFCSCPAAKNYLNVVCGSP